MPITRSSLLLTLLAGALFVLLYRLDGVPVTYGADPSYFFALNHFFAHGVVFGRDVVYSYGPLGFLAFPQPVGNNLLIGMVIKAALLLALIGSLLYLNRLRKQACGSSHTILGIGAVCFLGNLLDLPQAVFFLGVALLLLFKEKRDIRWLHLAFSCFVFAGLIKVTYLVTGSLVVAAYVCLLDAPRPKARWWGIQLIGAVAILMASWRLTGADFAALGAFLRASWEFSSGNSSALSLSPPMHWWAVFGGFALIGLAAFYERKDGGVFLLGILALPILAYFKYAVSRADVHHLPLFEVFVASCAALFLIHSPKIRLPTLSMFIGAVALFHLNTRLTLPDQRVDLLGLFRLGEQAPLAADSLRPVTLPEFVRLGRSHQGPAEPASIWPDFSAAFSAYRARLVVQSARNLEAFAPLPQSVLQAVGAQTIDFFPFETSYAYRYPLNWKPRPVFQEHMVFTPYLDALNAAFLRGTDAPQHLLWSAQQAPALKDGSAWTTTNIDGRYLLNDSPASIYEIFRNYRVAYSDDRLTLWTRSPVAHLDVPRITSKQTASWRQWIKVSSEPGCLTRVRLEVARPVLGAVKRLVYKEDKFRVFYRTVHGQQISHRLTLDTAAGGVWVDPYMFRIDGSKSVPVAEIAFEPDEPAFAGDEIQLTWECIGPRPPLVAQGL